MINLDALSEPFTEAELEWRVQQSGIGNNGPWAKIVPYITNRAIMNRLDSVCGMDGWQNEFRPIEIYRGENKSEAGFLCGIGIFVRDAWVWKWDGSNCSDIESIKGGLSGSMKRTAVQWGMGRYLYEMEEGWAIFKNVTKDTPGAAYIRIKDKQGSFTDAYWLPPKLPQSALPGKVKQQPGKVSTDKLADRRKLLFERWKSASADKAILTHFGPVSYGENGAIHTGKTFESMSEESLQHVEDFLNDGALPAMRR